jgi:hypothetical protein
MQRIVPKPVSVEYEKPKASLSCLQCQRRKKKCDKNSPCLACTQAGIACTAISRARLPRGRHAPQRDSGDLRQRVARLEELLLSQKKIGQPFEVPPQKDDSSNVLSDSAWTSISEEVFGIRELVDSLAAEDEPPAPPIETAETDRVQRFDILLYGDAPCFIQPYVLESPPEAIVSALMGIHLHRVDPVLKVTHAPSLRDIFLLDVDTITPAQAALRFAVLFTAVSILDEEECFQRLNSSKSSLRSRLQLAAEVSLSRTKLLTTANLTTLQSLVIYLVSFGLFMVKINCAYTMQIGLRTCNGCRQVCFLLATAVRIGQCLGLDLEKTNHTPFETELRRRIWYSISILDLQATFDIGSHSPLAGGALFRAAPLHINDADISPGDLTPPPNVRYAFTEMTFCSATHDMTRYMRKMIHVPLDFEGRPLMQQDWAQRHAIVEECARDLHEKFLKYCNSDEPFQLFTRIVCEAMIVTMRLLIRRPMYSFYSTAPPPSDDLNVLDVAMDVLVQTLRKTENHAFKPWGWFHWVKWYALAVLLAELCEHTEGTNVDKAWAIAEVSFSSQMKTIRDDALRRSIEKLMRKAQSARSFKNAAAVRNYGLVHNNNTAFGVESNGTAGFNIPHLVPDAGEDDLLGEQGNFLEELDMLSWNNWESFVQNLGDPVHLDPTNGYF